VDAGISARQIVTRLELIGEDPTRLDGVLITHEHGDHVAGLAVFCRKYRVPLYCTTLTAESLGGVIEPVAWRRFTAGATFVVNDVEIQSFYVPHDAVDPVGFVLSSDKGAIGFLTDLGYAPKLALERLRGVHTLLIETNHDERMLQETTRRPWPVKQRILSRHGHLSNTAAAQLVAEVAGERLRRVVLGHLSRDCNRPELALEAMHQAGLDRLALWCADQNQVSPVFTVERPLPARKVKPVRHQRDEAGYAQTLLDLGWQWAQA
jgi:phosphoribosyl 1,2-cyclic phosphodiesterase